MKADLLLAKLAYIFKVILFIIMLLVFTSDIVTGQSALMISNVAVADKTNIHIIVTYPKGWIQPGKIHYPELEQGYNFDFIEKRHRTPGDIYIPIKYDAAVLPAQVDIHPQRKKKIIGLAHLQHDLGKLAA